jgi:hypothetical protein
VFTFVLKPDSPNLPSIFCTKTDLPTPEEPYIILNLTKINHFKLDLILPVIKTGCFDIKINADKKEYLIKSIVSTTSTCFPFLIKDSAVGTKKFHSTKFPVSISIK